MRVYLRGGDACMPKQLLHGTHVGTALDKMRGERMAQRMRMQRLVDVRTFPRNPDDLPNRLSRQSSSALVEKQGAMLLRTF